MKVFVIMPFDSELDDVYLYLIKAPLEKNGHTVSRADDVATHQSILRGIVQNISEADLVVADLTARNPNVYYELGIAHTLKKNTIQIVQDLEDVPFDLRSHAVFVYSLKYREAQQLSEEVLSLMQRASSGDFVFSNPVTESLGRDSVEISLSLDTQRESEEESDDYDESEMGMLDGVVAAEESVKVIEELGLEIATQFQNLSGKIQSHANKINELNASPNQKGYNSKRLQVVRKFATDLDEFSENIKDTIPKMHDSWETVDQGLGIFFSYNQITNDVEREAIQELDKVIKITRGGLKENRAVFQTFRDSQDKLRGLSRATDRALSNSDGVLQNLNDEFGIGEAVLTRMIDLADEMLDRYSSASDSDGENG